MKLQQRVDDSIGITLGVMDSLAERLVDRLTRAWRAPAGPGPDPLELLHLAAELRAATLRVAVLQECAFTIAATSTPPDADAAPNPAATVELLTQHPLAPIRSAAEFSAACAARDRLAALGRDLTREEGRYFLLVSDLIDGYAAAAPQPNDVRRTTASGNAKGASKRRKQAG